MMTALITLGIVLAGYVVGVKVPIIFQLIIAGAAIAWIRERNTGMDGIIHQIGALVFIAAILVGDIVFVLTHGVDTTFIDTVIWLFTP